MNLSNSKTIAKNTFYLYFRMILSMFISLFTVRIVFQALGVIDYGIYNAVGGIVTSLTFLTSVLANASQRFFALEIGKGVNGKLSQYFSAVFSVYLLIAIVLIIVIESLGGWLLINKMIIPSDRIYAATWVLHLSLYSFIISVISNPFQALLVAYEKMNVYAYVGIIETIAKLTIAYLLFISSIDLLILYSLLMLFVSIGVNLTYIIFCRKCYKIRINIIRNKILLSEIFRYCSWTLVGSFSGVCCLQGTSVLLNIFVGPIANSAFAISNQVSNAVLQFSSSFYNAVRPPLIKSFGVGDNNYMNTLFNFSNKALFVLTFSMIMPLFVKTEFLLSIWLGNVHEYMVSFVRIMLIYSLVLTLHSPITTIVQSAGKVKLYHSVVDGFALLILPISYFLLHLGYKPQSVLISSVIIFTIAHFLRLVILQRVISFSIKMHIKNFLFPSAQAVIVAVLFSKLINTIQIASVVSNILIIIFTGIIVLFISFFLVFTRQEINQVIKLIIK